MYARREELYVGYVLEETGYMPEKPIYKKAQLYAGREELYVGYVLEE